MIRIKDIFIGSLFFSFLFLLACEKAIEVDLPPFKSRLVVNTVFSTEEALYISVKKTQSVLVTSNSNYSVPGATVTVSDKGTVIATLRTDEEGACMDSFVPISGHTYHIEVKAEGFTTAETEFTMPKANEIGDVKVVNGTQGADVTVIIDDSKELSNYYGLSLYNGNNLAEEVNKSSISFEPSVTFEQRSILVEYQGYQQILLFKDGVDNGKELKVSLRTGEYSNLNGEIVFELWSMNKELYDYLKSYELQRWGEDDGLFTEQVTVQTNITNGLGIAGGRVITRKTVVVE